jgi:hypothetical protein
VLTIVLYPSTGDDRVFLAYCIGCLFSICKSSVVLCSLIGDDQGFLLSFYWLSCPHITSSLPSAFLDPKCSALNQRGKLARGHANRTRKEVGVPFKGLSSRAGSGCEDTDGVERIDQASEQSQ